MGARAGVSLRVRRACAGGDNRRDDRAFPIATNIVEALRGRLRGGPCRPFRGDLKIIVNGRVRCPDAVVTCTPVANGADVVPEPVVVFEVLSQSTDGVDRISTNADYRAMTSFRHYVMLEQSAMGATVFSRPGADWVGHLVTGEEVLAFSELGAEVPLQEIYDGIEFAAP